ncbi:hypothetical protein Taro_014142 [Colocasia esculenta]|uniref:Multipolar spindle 1 n=1 Tax=Colocasia esculenta TaxID=4460 RepID=A0A843UE36_COLES|nr:hypothetical protein [Colocasia esculenta]
MATFSTSSPKPATDLDALKIAVAVAVLRSKQRRQQSSFSSSSSVPAEDSQRWKRKAKERKREVTALREELKQLEECGKGVQQDVFPLSCRCHFFDGCGASNSGRPVSSGGNGGNDGGGSCDHWIDDVLRRRFLRHGTLLSLVWLLSVSLSSAFWLSGSCHRFPVRWKERQRRLEGAVRKRHCIVPIRFLEDPNDDDEMERLSISVDFLVELCGSNFPDKDTSVTASSHQAVDSILVSLKKLLFLKKDDKLIEEIVYSLITRLLQRMCTLSRKEGSSASGRNSQLCVQHLIRKLSNEPFVGQRAMFLVSRRISSLADSLTIMDPFDDAFPDMHDCMFMMMQLIEFMISDNLQIWTTNRELDSKLFEEWLRSVLQARKVFEVLENRNGLYLIYLERIIGEVANQVGPLSKQGKLDLDILFFSADCHFE